MQSHASTPARTLKIPSTGSHTVVWIYIYIYTKILHTLIGMGSAALLATVPYRVNDTNFPQGAMKYLKKYLKQMTCAYFKQET